MFMISSGPDRTPRNNRKESASLRGARSASKRGRRPLEYIDGPQPEMLRELPRIRGLQPQPQPEMLRELPRNRFPRQDESAEAVNFARILFGPGALQGRGGSGYQGLDTETMKEAARAMAIQSRMQMPEEPRVRDMPNMTLEEMEPYNRPAPDINDVFFGPDRKRFDIVEFITNLIGGK